MKILGSVAIVTGGSRGLGRAFSEELLKRGGKVCLADINEIEGKQTEQILKQKYGEDMSLFVKCDVTSDQDFKSLWAHAIDKFKTIDLLVNNAGILKESMMEKTVDVNLKGVMRGSMMAFEHMRRDKGGKGGLVVNVASTAGLFPIFFMPVYAASKYGVIGFTRSWAMNPSQKTFGVNFACLCPSFTETAMLTDTVDVEDPPLVTYKENKAQIHQFIDTLGTNRIDEVVATFIGLVEKDDNNGAVVTMDKEHGTAYRFTKHPYKL